MCATYKKYLQKTKLVERYALHSICIHTKYYTIELGSFIFQSSNFNPQTLHIKVYMHHYVYGRAQGIAIIMVRYTPRKNTTTTTNLFLLYHKKPTKGEEYKRFRMKKKS